MKITLTNSIHMDHDTETIEEHYRGELTIKGNFRYLVYQNTDNEKVVIRFNSEELSMIRYSNPNSQMKFLANGEASCTIPTPVGKQHLITKSSSFILSDNSIHFNYQLFPIDSDLPLATYDLSICYGS